MPVAGRGPRSLSWWAAWVLVCAPAGALAGFGLVEFYWEYPPGGYDGGFMGDLVFFGGFLALGQAPFVAVFAWFISRGPGKPAWQRYVLAAGVVVAWPLAGFVGWTLGSFVEVSLPTPLYSSLYVLGRSVRWLVVGLAEGVILAAVCAAIPGSVGDGRGAERDTGRSRIVLFGLCAAWVALSAAGGLLFESWASLDVAARTNELNEAIGGFLESFGVAANVAYVVVPHAIFLPILYGIPTGLVFLAIHRAVREERR